MMLDERQTEENIKFFIVKKSKLVNDTSELDKDARLFSSGLIDSLTFVELILFIEGEFKIKFSDTTEVTMNSMDSIALIVQAIGDALSKKR